MHPISTRTKLGRSPKFRRERDREDGINPDHRPRGRPRVCYTYQECKKIIQEQNLPSVTAFMEWWATNRPARVPKRPDRAYRDRGWEGWNLFLGNNNHFPTKGERIKSRSYKDAMSFARAKGIKKCEEYFKLSRAGGLPADMPRRPDFVYGKTGEWISWKHFLGTISYADKIIQGHEVGNYAFIMKKRKPGVPMNVYTIGITKYGDEGIRKILETVPAKVIAIYNVGNDTTVTEILGAYTKHYWNGDEDDFVVENLYDLMATLEEKYLPVRIPGL